MKTAFGSIAVLALGLGFVTAVGGCEARDCPDNDTSSDGGTETRNEGSCVQLVSLTRFNGTADSRDVAYAGGDVTIDGRNGDISVQQGSAGTVTAVFKPFVMRAADTPDSEIQANIAQLNIEAGGDASLITLKTTRDSGAPNTLGADILVTLPPEFNGALRIIQDNGRVNVGFAGAATHLGINSDNGQCDFNAGSAARTVDITCDNGDITGAIPVPADAGPVSTVTSGNGSIDLKFGTGATPFNVSAQALDGGSVITTLVSSCTENAASESSKTVSCNGATSANPTYTVTASGTSLADVNLQF